LLVTEGQCGDPRCQFFGDGGTRIGSQGITNGIDRPMDTFDAFALDVALVSDRFSSIPFSSPLLVALMLFQSCLVGTSGLSMERTILFYLPSRLRNPQSLSFLKMISHTSLLWQERSCAVGAATRNHSNHRFLGGADCGAITSLQI